MITVTCAIILKNDKIVKQTFSITYTLLLTTGAICFIESLTTKDAKIRHIMNIETCISIIAGVFYGKFIKMIDEKGIKSVAYGNMVGLLIEAIKELSEQNKQLISRIESLENK